MVVETWITLDDLMAMPDDGQRHELLRGDMIVSPLLGFDHGTTQFRCTTILGRHVGESGQGVVVLEPGFVRQKDPLTVLGPDPAFIRSEQVPRDAEGTTCLEAGVLMVLVLELKRRTVTVHTPDRVARTLVVGETLDVGDVLPGLSVAIADLLS